MNSQGCYSPNLTVESLPLDQIVKNEDNARQHNSKQIEKLTQSIRIFGFLVPVIVDDGNLLLCGHARAEAAQQAGIVTVPAIRVSHLNELQKRAFMIADNRLAELASWDEALLKNDLQFLSECDIDFDFSAIGFETPELDFILNGSAPGDVEEDRLPEATSDHAPISKPGNLWLLGEHRLYCGDALQPAYRTNVWDYQGINSFGKERDALLASHPTAKPVALVADAIQDCSKRRDLVLDPFAGSGTTIIAASPSTAGCVMNFSTRACSSISTSPVS